MIQQQVLRRLTALLNNLYLCTGIKFALLDDQGREVYSSSHQAPFCGEIMREPGGIERCYACDRHAVALVSRTHARHKYICHAGLYEVAVPVMEQKKVIAIILFGQMLDTSPRPEQWLRISQQCAWHTNQEALLQAFQGLRQFSSQQMTACMDILEACIHEAKPRELIYHDKAFVFRNYIDLYFSQELDIQALCQAMHMGKTQLYDLCRRHFQQTPIALLNQKRIEVAKDMLLSTDEPICNIAKSVGIPDQNYFTKLFKRMVGCVPSVFRSQEGDFC